MLDQRGRVGTKELEVVELARKIAELLAKNRG
jgi:hypothetical protein